MPATWAVLPHLADGWTTVPHQAVVPDSDDEQDEYDALLEAAERSGRLLPRLPGQQAMQRRVVVVVDVEPHQLSGDAVVERIAPQRLAAVFIDEQGTSELQWFAPAEIPALLG